MSPPYSTKRKMPDRTNNSVTRFIRDYEVCIDMVSGIVGFWYVFKIKQSSSIGCRHR